MTDALSTCHTGEVLAETQQLCFDPGVVVQINWFSQLCLFAKLVCVLTSQRDSEVKAEPQRSVITDQSISYNDECFSLLT